VAAMPREARKSNPMRMSFRYWSMIFSENRSPPRIKSGAGFFGIML